MQAGSKTSANLLNTVESFGILLAKGINGTGKVIEKDNIGMLSFIVKCVTSYIQIDFLFMCSDSNRVGRFI